MLQKFYKENEESIEFADSFTTLLPPARSTHSEFTCCIEIDFY